jgi:hypothetical protein
MVAEDARNALSATRDGLQQHLQLCAFRVDIAERGKTSGVDGAYQPQGVLSMKAIAIASAILMVSGAAVLAQSSTDSGAANSANTNGSSVFKGSPGTQKGSAGGGSAASDNAATQGGSNDPKGQNQTGDVAKKTPQEAVQKGDSK